MLTNSDYFELLTKEPTQEETLFYYDRPVIYYTITQHGEKYLVMLVDEDNEVQTETFLLVCYSDTTHTLLGEGHITPKEFFIHPENIVHKAVIEYSSAGPVILSGEQYENNTAIPEDFLPMETARWKSI